jgi:hypothetical protein
MVEQLNNRGPEVFRICSSQICFRWPAHRSRPLSFKHHHHHHHHHHRIETSWGSTSSNGKSPNCRLWSSRSIERARRLRDGHYTIERSRTMLRKSAPGGSSDGELVKPDLNNPRASHGPTVRCVRFGVSGRPSPA